MKEFQSNGATFTYTEENKGAAPIVIWAHGWGQSGAGFKKLVEPLKNRAHHIVLDLPGFGAAPPPSEDWGTKDYATAIAQWIIDNNMPPVLWVGHSFGCRVGVQIAARFPKHIQSMCLISGAGLKRRRPIHKKIYFFLRIRLYKALKKLVPNSALKDKIMAKFGSADYKSAGPMRKIFVRVVNEDLSPQAQDIECPVTLIYGQNDTETPPEFGERFSNMITDSKLHLLDEQDHYSVLQDGRHPVIKIVSDWIKDNT